MLLAAPWARYSGSAETKLQQDVALVANGDPDPVPELEAAILRERGRVVLEEGDLDRATVISAVAYLVRIVARHRNARDWFTGVHVYDRATGRSAGGERHHVFPKKILEQAGMTDSRRINAVANRVLLTRKAPLEIRKSSPADYLPHVHETQPDALRAQSVPLDPELWEPQRRAALRRVRDLPARNRERRATGDRGAGEGDLPLLSIGASSRPGENAVVRPKGRGRCSLRRNGEPCRRRAEGGGTTVCLPRKTKPPCSGRRSWWRLRCASGSATVARSCARCRMSRCRQSERWASACSATAWRGGATCSRRGRRPR